MQPTAPLNRRKLSSLVMRLQRLWLRILTWRFLLWLPIIVAFPVLGYVVGWLVGASQTPVVGTLLPLVFALFGALGYKSLSKAASVPASLPIASFWAFGIIMFCVGCYDGTRAGIRERVQDYPPLSELLEDTCPYSDEWASLHLLRWHLQYHGVPVADCRELFRTTILPILRGECKQVPEQDGLRAYLDRSNKASKTGEDAVPLRSQILEGVVRNIVDSNALSATPPILAH